MNKRLKVTLKILDNVASKYPETTTKKNTSRLWWRRLNSGRSILSEILIEQMGYFFMR